MYRLQLLHSLQPAPALQQPPTGQTKQQIEITRQTQLTPVIPTALRPCRTARAPTGSPTLGSDQTIRSGVTDWRTVPSPLEGPDRRPRCRLPPRLAALPERGRRRRRFGEA